MTVVMTGIVVAAFLGIASMMPSDCGVTGRFFRTTSICDGVGVVASRVAVIPMLGSVVCVVVGCIRMMFIGIGILVIVNGMAAVVESVFIMGAGRHHKNKSGKC